MRDFAEAEIAPHAEAWDASHTFPVDVVRQMGELGLFGIPFPEEYGGGGADLTTLCIAIEELARVDQSLAITLEAGVGLGANPIFRFGTEEQRQRWLPDLCAGRALGGFGLTEPEAGSDAGGTRTTAVLDDAGAEWVINGAKAFITNSGTDITSLVTITARTGGAGVGRPGDLLHHRPGRDARVQRRPALPQDGVARLRHPWADVQRLPRARRQPAGGARPGLRPVPADPRRGPHRHRRAGRRGHPLLPGAVGRLRQRAPGLRARHRRQPGGGVRLLRPGRHGRDREPARLPGGMAAGQRQAVQARGGDGQAATPPSRR